MKCVFVLYGLKKGEQKLKIDKVELLAKFVHLVAAVLLSYTTYHLYVVLDKDILPDLRTVKTSLSFFSFWNLGFQWIYFLYCLVIDVFELLQIDKLYIIQILIKVKNGFFCVLAMPVSYYVALFYWGNFFYDRDLVYPDYAYKIFPIWTNHFLHTNTLIFPTLELVLTYRPYPNRIISTVILWTVFLYYMYTTVNFYKTKGSWPYQLLDRFIWLHRIIFFSGSLLCLSAFYFIGETVNNFIWRKKRRSLNQQ